MPPLKDQVISLLEERKYDGLSSLSSSRKIITLLISLSYDKRSNMSWRAMEAIGAMSREVAKTKPEAVRNLVGRLLWMIRDESGGIGWSVPEILGEIVSNNPVLCSDIAPIIASFHEEKMLTSGVLWALGRIGRINSETVEYAVPLVLPYLDSEDHTCQGYAAYALARMGAVDASVKIEGLKDSNDPVMFYEDGELKKKTLGQIAAVALKILHEA